MGGAAKFSLSALYRQSRSMMIINQMIKKNKVIGAIDDDPTPKIQCGDGAAYTLNSRDYKGVMILVIQKSEEDCKDHNQSANGVSR